MAKHIKTNGTLKDLPDAELETLQTAVGGYIEVIHLKNGQDMIVNEEGLLHKLPVNLKATRLAGYPIVGDAVLLAKGELR